MKRIQYGFKAFPLDEKQISNRLKLVEQLSFVNCIWMELTLLPVKLRKELLTTYLT